MAELKPCPFCGGEAKLVITAMVYGLDDIKRKYGYVRCGRDYPRCCVQQPDEVRLEDAIEAWNTRVGDRCKDCLVDRMLDDGK